MPDVVTWAEKATASGADPRAGAARASTCGSAPSPVGGSGSVGPASPVTVTGNSSTCSPPRPSLTRRLTTYVPGLVYSSIAWSVRAGAAPVPGSHATATTSPSGSEALAVAWTTRGAAPVTGATSASAVGARLPESSAGTTTTVPLMSVPCIEQM